MPVPADTHLPIAHNASDATIVLSAMVPATSVLAKARAFAQRLAFRKVIRLRAQIIGFAPIAPVSGRLHGCDW